MLKLKENSGLAFSFMFFFEKRTCHYFLRLYSIKKCKLVIQKKYWLCQI